ncbi:MAG: hypothetical protein M1818_006671 [Claussenomyces sp. TS43310]|nr:MAG: hypothetical protein M1818_006897 [Claussenomyces sp. TS43310]KAI9735093.1 MAG: hypothetical protein M1818_006671 [Claussenomyces sp. TS43310]
MSDEEELKDISEEEDLFGDENDAASEKVRQLSDQELDSGDDEGRHDRDADQTEVEFGENERAARVMDQFLARQHVPRPIDGQLHSFKFPPFLGLDPKPYDSSTFQLPEADHHSTTKSPNFSVSTTAETTMRFRKNPATGKLESNTFISHWSDGSTTLHIGDNTYELQSKPLAPPLSDPKGYNDVLDSHQYLAAPHMFAQILQVVGHITNQYSVLPNKKIADAALEKLSVQLQAATRGHNKGDNKDGIAVIVNTQDPELQKKQAEQAEKERMKAQRRRETAAAKAEAQTGRIRSAIGGGLSLDDLEGRGPRRTGPTKKRTAPSGPRRSRKRADYSDDEDDLPRGRHREDEYDLEDDFLAASDEEIEEEEASEEDYDDGIKEKDNRRAKRQKTEELSDQDEDADADAEGEIDDENAVPATAETTSAGDTGGGRRKRLIIEDDDDE